MIVPVFLIGMVVFLMAVGFTGMAYVKHRNVLVLEYERVLTLEHIKGLLTKKKQDKLENLKTFLFVTANNNEIPMPRPKTPEYTGYRTAYDIFNDAMWRRANTVAFTPSSQGYDVVYEIDGVAMRQPSLEREQAQFLVHFIKSLSDLDMKERRKPQKGEFKIRRGKSDVEWEVITAGSTIGEQVQIKLMGQQSITKIQDLGLTPEQLKQLSEIRDLKQGIFIVSGTKKSGVTSTFYALLSGHDAFLNSIDTLERRPTATLLNINQRIFSLSDDTGTTTYGKKLQSITRMGPDIVGVADCEDAETAKIVCNAAKEGKLIYITIEADSVIQALDKWINLVGDRKLAVEYVVGISNQRLLRKLCPECKQAYAPNEEVLRKFNLSGEKTKVLYRPGKVQYDKHGKPTDCETCQGIGFIGRMGIFEIIVINDQLRETIKQSVPMQDVAKHFRAAKMLYLQEQALRKVISGETAVNEMARIFSAPKRAEAPKQKTQTPKEPT